MLAGEISKQIEELPPDESRLELLKLIDDLPGDPTIKEVMSNLTESSDERKHYSLDSNAAYIAKALFSMAVDGLVKIEPHQNPGATEPSYNVTLTPLATRVLDLFTR